MRQGAVYAAAAGRKFGPGRGTTCIGGKGISVGGADSRRLESTFYIEARTAAAIEACIGAGTGIFTS
jgi:hypothetical protein